MEFDDFFVTGGMPVVCVKLYKFNSNYKVPNTRTMIGKGTIFIGHESRHQDVDCIYGVTVYDKNNRIHVPKKYLT
jgi:hypothetical protein